MLFFTQCFGAVLDLIHLRFQHYKAKRVFSAAGQLVCVVNPTHNLKYVSTRRAVTQSTPEPTGFHPHHHIHHHHRYHHQQQRHHHHHRHHSLPHHLHHQEAVLHEAPLPLCICPLFSCQWEGQLEVVLSHLRQSHRIDILQGAEIVFLATDMNLPAPADWIIMHSCLGHHFLLVLRKQEKYEGHPQFFATMMLIGTPTQADCFTYRLELNRNQRRLKWEATPRSVLECVDSIITDGDCLVLNTSLAQLFSDNGSLAIGIAISASKVHDPEVEI
ncbi:seven in absentia homolog 3 [Monodelphis domestica]|uniref:E3 ubiquitin-protein ligase n=1 Tax=Monodelphis domestica TaxID=13616 RepID=K7E4P4_MONDO|nr:seven in absentia homolog 3 [Monodelphis domestica]XP_007501644.1 seven in absentia homolog 3 [Monodelphis domestica]XP_007501645.1 seven in absentia homolog 3 [Monodelphis domestica]